MVDFLIIIIIGFAKDRNLQAVAGGSGENLTCFVE